MRWPKVCGCKRSYSPEQWAKLPDRKLWPLEDGTLELRRCDCGSHIAIPVGDEEEGRDAA